MIRFIVAVAIVLVPQLVWGWFALNPVSIIVSSLIAILITWGLLQPMTPADEHAMAWGLWNGHRLN